MKRHILPGAIAALLLSTSPVAVQAQVPAKDAKVQTAPDVERFDKQLGEAQAQIKRMQEQMERIRLTQDPLERQKLMQDHYLAMQSAMTAMHRMWGPGMMHRPGGMGWGGMHGHNSTLTAEQMRQRQYMMEQYMGMQQMMMDQMIMRQQWMTPPATK